MANCHSPAQTTTQGTATDTIVLVGAPNVGKSLLFHRLTGAYVTVSNYPGTTVEIARGKLDLSPGPSLALLDTPGLRSLLPITEEEQITKDILSRNDVAVIVHVVDAKD